MTDLLADLFAAYPRTGFFDELIDPRQSDPAFALVRDRLATTPLEELKRRAALVGREFHDMGVTFTVYSDRNAIDRVLPFDVVPRLITAAEWARLEEGIRQRVTALNLFLADIYGPARILADGVIPADLVRGNPNYRAAMQDFAVPHGTYVHVCGIDLVRDETGSFRVLEDNARTPSGVSYVVENRHMMLRTFPGLFDSIGVRPVDDYGMRLQEAMASLSPADDPLVVLLTPGIYNAAYFEHVFLAREMGVPLVEGRDLCVEHDKVYLRSTAGLKRVDVIYRRIDDDFLDPEVFRADSCLGVRGLMRAWRRGNVAIANAVGTGVADDKAVYAYMPRIIRYYLNQDAIIPNVETRLCREPAGLAHTLDHLHELVVKPVGESGGYGMLVGPHASRAEIAAFAERLKANPDNYISQPMLGLSVAPTLTENGLAPRHVDLRPYVITGRDSWVLPGGLTRVALRPGSLVVNSSQGGGSKDTWVLT